MAETSEELLDDYFENDNLTTEQILLRASAPAWSTGKIVPVFCGSAFKNKGVQPLLDAVVDFLPSPADIPAVTGETPAGEPVVRHPDDSEPFSGVMFKVQTDPFVGRLSYVRVYSGTLNSGDHVLNATKGRKDRVGRILKMHANTREDVTQIKHRRHRGLRRPEGRLHRRHPVGHRRPDHPREDGLPRAGHLRGRRAGLQGRPGQAVQGPRPPSPRRTPPSG